MKSRCVYIGYDSREYGAFAICRESILRFDPFNLKIKGLVLSELQAAGLYTRETKRRYNQEGKLELIDVQSVTPLYNGRISTEHANARFLVPMLNKTGLALFCDCDIMFRVSAREIFDLADDTKAIQVVHHDFAPEEKFKMDGQLQTVYPRKNQSSVMLINCDHPAHKRLTLEDVNTRPGRDLHRFFWLKEEEIGQLPPEYNYLEGETELPPGVEPKVVHYTRGIPDMAGYENVEFADEWNALKPIAVRASDGYR